MKVVMTNDQLRREAPGGIGTYIRGLLQGLQTIDGVSATPWSGKLPLKLTVQAWDLGLLRPPRGYDIAHATSPAIPAKPAVPMTAIIHDLAWRHFPEAFPPRGRRWHEAALGRVIKRANVIFALSLPTADELLREGVDHKRVAVVGLGADHVAQADDARAQQRLDQLGVSGEFLLTVGTFQPRKNLARLMAAYKQMREKLPEPWPLLIVGSAGWGEKVKPVEGVYFLHDVDNAELSALYKRARLLAYVPLLEGFGLPVVEAMRQGTAVVSTSVPSAGGATQLVDASDVSSIAAGLLQVASDDDLRLDLVERGHKQASKFTWAACAQAHVDVWSSLVGGAPARNTSS